jgi:hypothetical protein
VLGPQGSGGEEVGGCSKRREGRTNKRNTLVVVVVVVVVIVSRIFHFEQVPPYRHAVASNLAVNPVNTEAGWTIPRIHNEHRTWGR